MSRSTSVTVTLAPVTTAPLGSRTRPTMAPASFCAHSGVASARNIEKNRIERVCRRRKEICMATLLDAKPEGSQAAWLGPAKVRVSGQRAFGVILRTITFTFVLYLLSTAIFGRGSEQQSKEVTHDRPKKLDCAALYHARSHAPADGLLEVAEVASDGRDRQARTHPGFRD